MANQYGVQKVRLEWALWLLYVRGPERSGEIVWLFQEWFGCRERTAKDNLGVLVKAGYLEPDEAAAALAAAGSLIGLPGVFYRVSARGRRLIGHRNGPHLLRVARKLFTTCPSDRVKRFRNGLIDRYGSAEAALASFEKRDLLSDEAIEAVVYSINRNSLVELEAAYRWLLSRGVWPQPKRRPHLRGPIPAEFIPSLARVGAEPGDGTS